MRYFDLTDGVSGGIDPDTFNAVSYREVDDFLTFQDEVRSGRRTLPTFLTDALGGVDQDGPAASE